MRGNISPIFFFAGIIFLSITLGCGGGTEGTVPSGSGGSFHLSPGGSYHLSIEGDHLSVKIDKAPLGLVLADLEGKTKIRVEIEGVIAREEVSVEFKDLPLEEGIERILKGRNYSLIYGPRVSAGSNPVAPKVVGIKVFTRGGGSSGARASGESAMTNPAGGIRQGRQRSLQELMEEAKAAADPLARVNALEAMVDQGEEEDILPAITSALQDEDLQVRDAALEILEDDMSGPLPIGPIAEVALKDRSSQLRMNALQLLVDTHEMGALDTLNKALQDPDIRVRGLARELLDELMKKGQ